MRHDSKPECHQANANLTESTVSYAARKTWGKLGLPAAPMKEDIRIIMTLTSS